MIKNIAIIGAGQLGSRHLQGLALCDTGLAIYLVDPSRVSLRTAEERYRAIKAPVEHSLTTVASIAELPKDLELVIVACTANHRFSIYKDLIEQTKAKTILLEKVLFQDLTEYPKALALDATSNTKTIVNLAQRLWPFFRQVRDEFQNKDQLRITITGSNWGLGCNGIHNVDIASFVWGTPGETKAYLDKEVIESKRKNFYEFTGSIETRQPGGGVLTQISYAQGAAPFVITAQSPEITRIWNISYNRLISADITTNWQFVESEMGAPFQSNLTTQVIGDVLAGKTSDLPDLAEASAIHVETLTAILNAALANGRDFGTICPVT
ncbi:Gfo/Idh/MocA family oxidoreductase [uncultured Sulfitobacter sp.]|uniref:Gfo/Idh/MocA family oxidoreductase n=1 Tax=uncultured Sulfitobacter sp. TaxID=191468 RepID=UPI0030D7C144|tara:strand:- start:62201 stop:63172 length:972 start_codon:yes stop_codon:yes gene_type:complete